MDYYFSAWSFNNTPGYSPGLKTAVSTPCPDYFSLPFSDDFREGRLSGCWEEDFAGGAASWSVTGDSEYLPDSAAVGSYALMFDQEVDDAGHATRLVGPPMQYGDYDYGHLSFYMAGLEYNTGKVSVTVMFREKGDENWNALADFEASPNGWVLHEVELPPAAQGFQLAFLPLNIVDSGGVLLDGVSVKGNYSAAFPGPKNFVLDEAGSDYVRLTWERPYELSGGEHDPALEGYRVYRNDVLQHETADPDALSFLDKGMAVGRYRYYARAVYSDPYGLSDATSEVIGLVEEGPVTYNLNMASEGAGKTYPREGTYLYNEGAEITIRAKPDTNARFVRWVVNGEEFSGDPAKEITVSNELDIKAIFAPVEHEVVLASYPENIGVQSGGGNYAHGSLASVETSLPENVKFLDWRKGNHVVSVLPAFDYPVYASDTLVAHFHVPVYRVAVDVDPLNGGRIAGAGEFYLGDQVSLEATPGSDFLFSHWELDGEVVHESSQYSFTLEGPLSLTAVFKEKPLALEIRVMPHEGGETMPGGGVSRHEVGDVVELVAAPAMGFRMSHWDIDGRQVFNDVAQIVMRGDMVATAVFDSPVSADAPDGKQVRVFPNPVRHSLTVSWPSGTGIRDIRLKTLDGRTVYERTIQSGEDGGEVELSVADLSPGVYIIRLAGPDEPVIRRVLVY